MSIDAPAEPELSAVSSPNPDGSAPAARGRLLVPCLIVFLSGFCVMVIELVAGRLVHGYIGSSLYTWTTVIGVILAGITMGNYIGGCLADRYESKRLVGTLFLLSAVLSLSILPATRFVGAATAGWTGSNAAWSARIVTVIVISFLLPGTALGTISPAVAKWALDHGLATGRTVGSVYAWNTIGSIIGTFATGFILLARFGATTIVLIATGGLALIGLAFAPAILVELARGRRRGSAGAGAGDPGSEKSVAPSNQPRAAARIENGGPGLFLPCLLVFLSGFSVMLVELVASRLTSVHIGQSLYTWTSVIGVILAGISVGNYLGGQMADRFETKGLIGALFLVASFFCLSLLHTHEFVANATRGWLGSTPWGARVLLVVFLAYFFPAAVLGTISPAVAKWALDRGGAPGRTVGTVYAWNTIGSIVGTFATGFFLISTFYISRLVAATSLGLALLAVLFLLVGGNWSGRLLSLGWLAITAVAFLFVAMPPDRFEEVVLTVLPVTPDAGVSLDDNETREDVRDLQLRRIEFAAAIFGRSSEINVYDGFTFANDFLYYDETNYYTLVVNEKLIPPEQQRGIKLADAKELEQQDDRLIRSLTLDALVHGFLDMDDLSYLHYEYEHVYAVLGNRVLEKNRGLGQDIRALFLGGGSYTFPRYLEEKFPGIECTIAEIDPGVTRAVERAMGLNQANTKAFVLLADEHPPAGLLANNPVPGPWPVFHERTLTPGQRLGAIFEAFRPRPWEAFDRARWTGRIEAAGGRLVNDFSGKVDYLLDVRADKQPDSPLVAQANEAGVEILDGAGFEKLVATSPFPNIVTHHRDARQFVMEALDERSGAFDVIFADAFNDFSVPAHLTTVEFSRELAKLLKPDGLLMLNVIDVWRLSKFMGSYRNTLRQVFEHVYVLSMQAGTPSATRSTFVIVGSQHPLDFSDFGKRAGEEAYVGTLLTGPMLGPVVRGGLEELGAVRFTGDGKTSSFTLPWPAHAASVELTSPQGAKLNLLDDAYSIEAGTTLKLALPPVADAIIDVRLYSDREIILTDDYCPVDNFLAEVIATRVRTAE